MTKSKKTRTKPAVKSKVKKIPTLDWGQADRNISTLRKIEKANFDEQS